MKLIYCLIVLILFSPDCFPQSTKKKKKKKVYRIEMTLVDGTKSKGTFYSVDEGFFTIANVKKKDTLFQAAPIDDVEKVLIRKNGIIGFCAAIGAFAGSLVGLMFYDDPECQPNEFCLDFGPGPPMGMGAVIGGVIGAAVGAGTAKTFKLKSEGSQVDSIVLQLRQYCYRCD